MFSWVLLLALATTPEVSVDPVQRFLGVYEYTDKEQGEAAIAKAVEAATEELNFIMRPVARSKFKEKNIPSASIAIRRDGAELTIETAFRSWSTDLKAKSLTVSLPGGRTGLVSKTLEGRQLIELVTVAQTTREHRYSVSEDGLALTLLVTIVTPKLSKPIVYELLYRRQKP